VMCQFFLLSRWLSDTSPSGTIGEAHAEGAAMTISQSIGGHWRLVRQCRSRALFAGRNFDTFAGGATHGVV
jgi:hypothetical protein